jgi:thioesterase domain-containing protein
MGKVYIMTVGQPGYVSDLRLPRNRSTHLTVLLDGVKEVGTRPGSQITKLFLDKGDFLKVRYPSQGTFDSESAAESVANFAAMFDTVTLVGVSAGGLLAYDALHGLQVRAIWRTQDNTNVRLLLVDTPYDRSDIKSNNARRLARWVPSRVALPQSLNRRLIGSRPELQPESDLTDDELHLIKTHHERVARLPVGVLASRLRFVFGHSLPQSKLLQDVPMAYLQSKWDPVVSGSAQAKWALAYDHMRSLTVGAEGHAAMLDSPRMWLRAFSLGFDKLEV